MHAVPLVVIEPRPVQHEGRRSAAEVEGEGGPAGGQADSEEVARHRHLLLARPQQQPASAPRPDLQRDVGRAAANPASQQVTPTSQVASRTGVSKSHLTLVARVARYNAATCHISDWCHKSYLNDLTLLSQVTSQ